MTSSIAGENAIVLLAGIRRTTLTYLITTLSVRVIGVRHWLDPELLYTTANLVLSGSLHR